MKIYEFVSKTCIAEGVGSDTSEVQRIVGTLRAAGFGYDLSDKDQVLGHEIVSDLLRNKRKLRVGKVLVTNSDHGQSGRVHSSNSDDRFVEIEAYIEQGKCPRCKTPMTKVKLGSKLPNNRDFMGANYCRSCKTTLWVK